VWVFCVFFLLSVKFIERIYHLSSCLTTSRKKETPETKSERQAKKNEGLFSLGGRTNGNWCCERHVPELMQRARGVRAV
jgi:hypothetical protein